MSDIIDESMSEKLLWGSFDVDECYQIVGPFNEERMGEIICCIRGGNYCGIAERSAFSFSHENVVFHMSPG